MPDTLSDVLTDAYAALSGLDPPVPVLMAGDPEREGDPVQVIVLQDVSSVPVDTYGLDSRRSRVQVTCYAETKLAALGIEARAVVALRGAGLHWIASRPAPDPENVGALSEYER